MATSSNSGERPEGSRKEQLPLWNKFFGTSGMVGLVVALVSLFTFLHGIHAWPFIDSSAGAVKNPSTSTAYTATAGPSCKTDKAGVMFFTSVQPSSGSWSPLFGSAAGGCGNALTHLTIDGGGAASWVFTPGVGKTCTFQIHIPKSNSITANRVTYQGWETLPGHHTDEHRIGTNTYENQEAHRGGVITIGFGPTKTGEIDLQLYDDNRDFTDEVAGIVTAICN